MAVDITSPVRIARPSRDLDAAERFWVDGLGLEVLFKAGPEAEGDHALLMVGWAGGQVVESRNPYWDRYGVTLVDPDGYRLVLSRRTWTV
jgi:catechol 2,3-dioxygenase-like lactoylglutathione lyase family enzyme